MVALYHYRSKHIVIDDKTNINELSRDMKVKPLKHIMQYDNMNSKKNKIELNERINNENRVKLK